MSPVGKYTSAQRSQKCDGEVKDSRALFRQKLDDLYYTSKLPYPSLLGSHECSCHVWHKPYRNYRFCQNCGSNIDSIIEQQVLDLKDRAKLARKDQDRLDAEFASDAIGACGLAEHPKASAAFFLAWNQGHSLGCHEVFSNLEDLANLLLDAAD